MWDSVIDVYYIHINRLFNSLDNKDIIGGVIEQTFLIARIEISEKRSSNISVQEIQRLQFEHKLLLSDGKIDSCDTIIYSNEWQSILFTRRFENTKVYIKEYRLKGEMHPQPAPTYKGSAIEDIIPYISAKEKKGQLAGRTIIDNWDDNGVKKQGIIKYNNLEHIVLNDNWWNGKRIKREFEYQYDSHNNWVKCKEYHDGKFVYLHLRQYRYK